MGPLSHGYRFALHMTYGAKEFVTEHEEKKSNLGGWIFVGRRWDVVKVRFANGAPLEIEERFKH